MSERTRAERAREDAGGEGTVAESTEAFHGDKGKRNKEKGQ